jgi:hypothetical protein
VSLGPFYVMLLVPATPGAQAFDFQEGGADLGRFMVARLRRYGDRRGAFEAFHAQRVSLAASGAKVRPSQAGERPYQGDAVVVETLHNGRRVLGWHKAHPTA